MKRTPFIISLLTAMLFASCEQNPRYSQLDGIWQVLTVEDKLAETTADAEGRLYISFEYELVKLTFYPEVRNEGTLGHEYVSYYSLQDNTLSMGTFYKYSYNISKTEKELAPPEEMSAFGIRQQPAAFGMTIEGQSMTLENGEARLTLRHY